MAIDLALDRQVGTLRVDEFAELIRRTVREELHILLEEPSHDDLAAQPPSLRDPDAIIAKMNATGKYNAKFLASLRKGMMRSQTFQKTLLESSK